MVTYAIIIAAMQPSEAPTLTRIRARYAETDQMGVVHHANYYVWMEAARVDLCQTLGIRYRDLEKAGILLAVIETSCRYVSPVRFDDEVLIETRMAKATARAVTFNYDISVAGRLAATGETRHVFLNAKMKPARLPGEYWHFFGLSA